MWEIEFTDEFEAWWDGLEEGDQEKIRVAVHPELQTLEAKKRDFGEVTVSLKDGRKLSHRAARVPPRR